MARSSFRGRKAATKRRPNVTLPPGRGWLQHDRGRECSASVDALEPLAASTCRPRSRAAALVGGPAALVQSWSMSSVSLDLEVLASLARWTADEAVRRLTGLADALTFEPDPERLAAVARALPTAVAELSPEVGAAVQQVAQRLVEHAPALPQDLDQLEPWLRVQWLRLGIAAGAPGLAEGRRDGTGALQLFVVERVLNEIVSGWQCHRATRLQLPQAPGDGVQLVRSLT